MDIVEIEVHQRAAGPFGIKRRRNNAFLEIVVTAGILAEAALHDLDIAKKRQPFADLAVSFHVDRSNCLKQEEFLFAGKHRKALRLSCVICHRLFDDDIHSVFKRFPAVSKMKIVGNCHIDSVDPRRTQLVQIRYSLRNPVLLTERFRLGKSAGASHDREDLEPFHFDQFRKKLLHDHSCPDNSKFHGVFLSLQ